MFRRIGHGLEPDRHGRRWWRGRFEQIRCEHPDGPKLILRGGNQQRLTLDRDLESDLERARRPAPSTRPSRLLPWAASCCRTRACLRDRSGPWRPPWRRGASSCPCGREPPFLARALHQVGAHIPRAPSSRSLRALGPRLSVGRRVLIQTWPASYKESGSERPGEDRKTEQANC